MSGLATTAIELVLAGAAGGVGQEALSGTLSAGRNKVRHLLSQRLRNDVRACELLDSADASPEDEAVRNELIEMVSAYVEVDNAFAAELRELVKQASAAQPKSPLVGTMKVKDVTGSVAGVVNIGQQTNHFG